jgi:hypothetical protein|tara:strand:- start:708 stop:1736 length:1029 start_codon:yes stop_codon:yes gene_type:complete
MAFFNKKEEVIDLELTPLGEILLAEGNFTPVFYAFYDDDILYDAAGAASVGEEQNDIEDRIQTNTPALKTQYLFHGVETSVTTLVALNRLAALVDPSHRENEQTLFPPSVDGDFSLIEPLGSMELGSENAPSWDIRVLKGELSGAINYITSSAPAGENSEVRRIPQLDFDFTYKVEVGYSKDVPPESRAGQVISETYNDGTYLFLSDGIPELIFSVDEKNASSDTQYDIEVFEVSSDPAFKNILTPKTFPEKIPIIVDNILLDQEQIATMLRDESPPTPDMVPYYFNIDTDLEIPEEQICELIRSLKTRGVEVDDIPYDCPDILAVGRFDIYDTKATGGEEC